MAIEQPRHNQAALGPCGVGAKEDYVLRMCDQSPLLMRWELEENIDTLTCVFDFAWGALWEQL